MQPSRCTALIYCQYLHTSEVLVLESTLCGIHHLILYHPSYWDFSRSVDFKSISLRNHMVSYIMCLINNTLCYGISTFYRRRSICYHIFFACDLVTFPPVIVCSYITGRFLTNVYFPYPIFFCAPVPTGLLLWIVSVSGS